MRSALPGAPSGSAGRPPASACRLSPGARAARAVIEEQRRAARRGRGARRVVAATARAASLDLDHLALAGIEIGRRGRALDERSAGDEALAPAGAATHELADRQRVEELVGEQEQRPGRQRVQRFVPFGPREPRLLHRAQARRGLDQMQPQRGAENAGAAWPIARSASAISVPRPGPASASSTGSGRPAPSQATAAHSPSNSPNTWLISGAVVKSA